MRFPDCRKESKVKTATLMCSTITVEDFLFGRSTRVRFPPVPFLATLLQLNPMPIQKALISNELKERLKVAEPSESHDEILEEVADARRETDDCADG